MNDNQDIFADMVADLIRRGVEKHNKGKIEAAADIYNKILDIMPEQPEALHLLGLTKHQTGHSDEALNLISKAVKLKPENPDFLGNLATVLADLKEYERAEQFYFKALEISPDGINFYIGLGSVQTAMGRPMAAEKCYRMAIGISPDYAEAYNNLGNALKDQDKLDEAERAYNKAIELNPHLFNAYNNIGLLFKNKGLFTDAEKAIRTAVTINPNDAVSLNNYGNILCDIGFHEKAVDAYKKALQISPTYAAAHSNLLSCYQYITGVNSKFLKNVHREWELEHGQKYRPFWNTEKPNNNKLVIGFVSPDMGKHPVGYFLIKILENLDKERCSTIVYSSRIVEDELTVRLKKAADKWLNTSAASDAALAEQIKADKVDFLFDLSGHTSKNRLCTFAMKPAPFQATWMGYVGTTGLKAMDYLIADKNQVKQGTENNYTEEIVYMPDGYVTYEAPEYAPEVSPLPALTNGYITFGSFNNPGKINQNVIEVWSKILTEVPNSRLIMKFNGFDDVGLSTKITQQFSGYGIDTDRITLEGKAPHKEFLDAYSRIDVALDTFPYSGGLTTCEALWQGVPVITCPGDTFASRHSLSHLSNVGLADTVTENFEEYVEKAKELAGNVEKLSETRKNLREKVAKSTLCDGLAFANNLLDFIEKTVNS